MKVTFVKKGSKRYAVEVGRDRYPDLWCGTIGHDDWLPHDLLHFVAESQGFTDIEILRLHPRSTEHWLGDEAHADWARLNQLLFGPQDYSIIARKPGQ